jgi:alkylation response protein AidB-like acyl-CoA dehydrogenase
MQWYVEQVTQINKLGVWPSGTTYITFEDVKVPVENLIGKENDGNEIKIDK